MTTLAAEDIIASIEVMRVQEESTYKSDNYLYQQQQEDEDYSFNSLCSGRLDRREQQSTSSIDGDCRSKMAEWCYQVVDFCKFKRETCNVAMSYLDRYMSTDIGRAATHNNRKTFQLAAMTCLYTAVKLHEPEAIDPKLVSGLSRGIYSEQQIVDMEQSILQALQWRMNPPTAIAFVRLFFTLIPKETLSDEAEKTIFELTKFQTEVAINEHEFVSCNSSTIAIASIANALEGVSELLPEVHHMKDSYLEYIARISSVKLHSNEIKSTQRRLYDAITENNNGTRKTKLVPSSPVFIPKNHIITETSTTNDDMSCVDRSSSPTNFQRKQYHEDSSSPRCVSQATR